jgi:subtilase family serine protease
MLGGVEVLQEDSVRISVSRLCPLVLAGTAAVLVGVAPVLAAPLLPPQANAVAGSAVPVCPGPSAPGDARCHAQRRTDALATSAVPAPAGSTAHPDALGNNGAYDPGYLQNAYNLQSIAANAGSGATVAIVDAYDDRTAASDLASYRSYFGLPPCGNGCFTKVNQNGQAANYPRSNSGWAQEISLDLDMVSAICPNCHILLVEARSSSYSDLGSAVNYAASQPGVVAISNSYGGSEWSGETSYEGYYNHPGKMITVSSGDSGYGAEFPAASRYVTAVGGTSLFQLANTGGRTAGSGTESAWSGAGSGCSTYVLKPSWQGDTGCSRRTVADVSAVADPNTGVWVYYNSGWYVFGGTSVASPIAASVYALAANTSSLTYGSYSYSTGSLNDVTTGSNGSCGGSYLCTAGAQYDGPTGNGTPNGIGAF